MSKENVAASAPVHQLVGQLRELMAKATPGPLSIGEYGDIKAPSILRHEKLSVGGVSIPCGSVRKNDISHANRDLIVAAINALPALLAVAEAAEAILVCGDLHWHTPQADRSGREHDLRTALSLLPNAKADLAPASGAQVQRLDGPALGVK